MKVFISSEGVLPKQLEKLRVKIEPSKIHDFLYYSDIFIGDSGTMAVESAIMGTPSILFSSLAKKLGNFVSLSKNHSLLILCDNENNLMNVALELISNKNSNELWKKRAKTFMENKINFTNFLLWLFEDFQENKKYLIKKRVINKL